MDEKAKILIVEDERIIALEMRHKLESMGYDVSAIVSSGEEAVRKAEELHPDLVLMDIILQGEMDGVEAACQIKNRFGIPVVYVTANVSDARLEDITRSEPFGCLFKPFEDMELQAAVKMALYKYQMGEKLRESEENYRSVVENSHDGILIVGEDYRFTYVNDMFCRIAGYSRSEIIGQNFRKFIDEEGKRLVADRYKQRQAGTKPPPRYEFNVVRKDGTKRRVEISSTVSRDLKGKVRTIAQILDITEQKQAEKALRDSEKKYRTLAETTNDITFALDLDGKITYISPVVEKLTGYSWQDLVGHSFTKFIAPEYVESTFEHFKKGLGGSEIPLYEIEMKHKDGGTVPVELNVTSLLDATGKTTGRIGVARDITDRKKAEESLRKSEERFRTIFESSKEGYCELDLAGRFTLSNETMLEIMGFPAAELIGMHYKEYTSPETAKRMHGIFNKIYRTGKSAEITDYEITRKDGGKRTIELSTYLIRDEKGEPVGFREIVRDVTKRKETEESLTKSEERFRTIIETMEDGYYEVDLAGRFTFFNEAMRGILGFSANELIGMSNLEYTSPETSKRLIKTFNKVYRTGKYADAKDYELIRKDGTKRIVEFNASLIRDESGNPAGFRGIARDVSSRKEMEASLTENEERYRNLVENMSEVIFSTDDKGALTYVSPATEQMTGFKPHEITGRPLFEFLHPADIPRITEQFKGIISGISRPEEYRLLTKQGEFFWVNTHAQPIYENKRVIGLQGVLTNITDRKQAEEEIKNHQEHLALINQILRHDLTNDLVVIQSAINLYNKSPEEELLKEISSRTKKSIELINRMRELETFISRHRELQIHDMRNTIDEVIKNYPFIDFDIKGKARVMADDSIASVIDNIIRNAVIHGKADKITITTGKERDMCEVRIADNGTGIPDDIKKKIFEEGFKYGDTGNTGIGLHIVEKAMESYGGYAWVEDNEPKGAVFALRFRMVK